MHQAKSDNCFKQTTRNNGRETPQATWKCRKCYCSESSSSIPFCRRRRHATIAADKWIAPCPDLSGRGCLAVWRLARLAPIPIFVGGNWRPRPGDTDRSAEIDSVHRWESLWLSPSWSCPESQRRTPVVTLAEGILERAISDSAIKLAAIRLHSEWSTICRLNVRYPLFWSGAEIGSRHLAMAGLGGMLTIH